jgi:hypothetical protein
LRSKIKSGISILVIFLFLNAWSPNIILGFNKQLFMTDYPKEFAEYKKENIVK